MRIDRIHILFVAALLGCPADDAPANDTGDATEAASSSTAAEATETGDTMVDEPTTGGVDTSPLEIIGEYDDDYGGHHEITMTTWIYDTGEFGVVTTDLMRHDNDAQWVAGEDADMAGTFVRFDWTYDDEGALWYCNTVYDAASLDAAVEAPLADATDPATSGCGGMFPWTMLTPS